MAQHCKYFGNYICVNNAEVPYNVSDGLSVWTAPVSSAISQNFFKKSNLRFQGSRMLVLPQLPDPRAEQSRRQHTEMINYMRYIISTWHGTAANKHHSKCAHVNEKNTNVPSMTLPKQWYKSEKLKRTVRLFCFLFI